MIHEKDQKELIYDQQQESQTVINQRQKSLKEQNNSVSQINNLNDGFSNEVTIVKEYTEVRLNEFSGCDLLINMKLPNKYLLSKILRQSNNKLDFCEYCKNIVSIYAEVIKPIQLEQYGLNERKIFNFQIQQLSDKGFCIQCNNQTISFEYEVILQNVIKCEKCSKNIIVKDSKIFHNEHIIQCNTCNEQTPCDCSDCVTYRCQHCKDYLNSKHISICDCCKILIK